MNWTFGVVDLTALLTDELIDLHDYCELTLRKLSPAADLG